MERRRMRLSCFLNCCVLVCCFAVEGARHIPISETTVAEQHHGRSLSGAYDMRICRWFQDSSCQLNPEYARNLLSSSLPEESSEVQQTVLDGAECLSMTHEAACISRESCKWIEQDSAHAGSLQNRCQYSELNPVLSQCTHDSVQPFVLEYMRCQKQLDGRCNVKGTCSQVKLSADHQGCGIRGPLVLDLIISTPASQTEVVGQLIESASALQGLRLADVTRDSIFIGGVVYNGYRRLSQAVGSGGNALQVDEDAESGGLATEKSSITGTGDVEEDETSTDFSVVDGETQIRTQGPSSTGGTKEEEKEGTNEEATTPPQSSEENSNSEASEMEEEPKHIEGQVIFDVASNQTPYSDKATKDDIDSSTESLEEQIRSPLMLRTPTDHLTSKNASITVRLRDIREILDAITSVLEREPRPLDAVEEYFAIAAEGLEIMRFRLDSQMHKSVSQETWSTSNDLWWMLQESAELLDAAYVSNKNVSQTKANVVKTLSAVILKANETWNPNPGTKSRESKRLTEVKNRLEAVEKSEGHEETSDEEASYVVIDTLDKLVSVVVAAFEEALEGIYPQVPNSNFTEKYNQTWVDLYRGRNQKWRAIQEVASSRSEAGTLIVELVQGLYRTRSPNVSDTTVPALSALGNVVADLVGALTATHATDWYKILNLPEQLLDQDGLYIWQNGPQITAAKLDEARSQATKNLAKSYFVKFDNLLTVSHKIVDLLEATINMIDAKVLWGKAARAIPEATAILSTMEAALNVIADWNKFALANHLTSATEENPFGDVYIVDYLLSLVGCMELGMDESGDCRNTDRSQCQLTGLKQWNNITGQYYGNNTYFDKICVPLEDPTSISHLFEDLPEQVIRTMVVHTRDIYILTAYCPSLPAAECRLDERCELFDIENGRKCRPSSNFMNYLVEDKNITGLSAKTDSCRAYLNLPVCENMQSEEACLQQETCLWTQPPHIHANFNGSKGVCSTNWVEQLKKTNAETLQHNGLLQPYDVQKCRKQLTEGGCRRQSHDSNEARSHETHLPSSETETPHWLAYTLSIVAAFAVASTIFAVWRLVRKEKDHGSNRKKKGKPRKKADQTPLPQMPPPIMYAFETEPSSSPSRNRDDFAFVMEAIENANSFSTLTRSRVSSVAIERGVSGTATEMSEIQPISETEESESSDSGDLEEGEGWTSSSDEWSIDDDANSLPDVPT